MMNNATFLHYQFHAAPRKISGKSPRLLLFLHGLFGDLNNLGIIARAFAEEYDILRVDLRNHGSSFHSNAMDYALMAADLKALLAHLNVTSCVVIWHSMGGKTAMKLAELAPELVEQLVVIDIAPVAYPNGRHSAIFDGLFAVKNARPQTRQQAKTVMAAHIIDEGVQQFMLKGFDPQSPDCFRFNLTALHHNYENLMDWQPVLVDKPTLFIKGALSDYIQEKATQTILAQFPQARSFVVSNADHWVHAEKPEAVIRAIGRVLNVNPD